MLLKSRNIDATQGSIIQKILLYTFPLILSTLIQKLFNAVDIVVLGNMADSTAIAAVSATTSIVHLIVDSFVGLASGTKVIFARQFGARDGDRIKRTEDTSLILGVIIGVFVAVIGLIFAPWFLNLMNCPEECFDGAVIYIQVYICSAPAIMLYNFGSSVLTAAGDTQRPLYYIIAGGLLNLILNVVLCIALPQKVIAVAAATAASQILCAILVIRRLCKMDGFGKLIIKKMRFSMHAFKKIMSFGLPLALNHAMYPIANMQIQSAVNAYGVAATAGHGAAATLEGVLASFTAPFGTTCATFMGQNFGANKQDRAKKSFWLCLGIGVSVGLVFGIGFTIASPGLLLPLMLKDDIAAIDYGYWRMVFVSGFYLIAAMNTVLSSSIQAYGYSLITATNSIVCIFCLRMVWMLWIYPPFHLIEENFVGYKWLMACYTVTWTFLLAANVIGNIVIRILAKKKGIKQI